MMDKEQLIKLFVTLTVEQRIDALLLAAALAQSDLEN